MYGDLFDNYNENIERECVYVMSCMSFPKYVIGYMFRERFIFKMNVLF